MAKADMNDLLKKRMTANQQASELQTSNEAYEKLFRETPPPGGVQICSLPLDKLVPFFTADIGFRPYSPSQLQAFAEQLNEEGLLVRIIVRPMVAGTYEILAGHNRTSAAKLAGWAEIPAEIVEANDARAIVIATSTNLIQRQNLSIIERGKAYKALLTAKNRNGQRNLFEKEHTLGDSRQRSEKSKDSRTFGEKRQRYNARALVAEFFGVTEYEIRKAIKLTHLISPLQNILEITPKQLNLACADLIADYDPASQDAFVEICSIEGYQINKAAMQYIIHRCPPPVADRQAVFAAWREARDKAIERMAAPPRKITFDRKRFAPYLEDLGSDQELESLFLEFLRERVERRITERNTRNRVGT